MFDALNDGLDWVARKNRFGYTWREAGDDLARWLVWRLPHRVVYWCYIRVMANCTAGPGAVPVADATFDVAARAWSERRGGDRSFR